MARMPLPFQLDHINLWLLEDEEENEAGWTIVDTGIGDDKTRAIWEQIFARIKHVKRVILTHYHPDHAGNAEWICRRFGVQMWTTQGEYLTAHAVRASSAGYTSDAVLSVFEKNGLDAERSRGMATMRGNNRYSALVPEFPVYPRIIEGYSGAWWARLEGDHRHGMPGTSSLHCAERHRLAGDIRLSTISTTSASGPSSEATRCACSSSRSPAIASCPKTFLCCLHGKPFRAARPWPRLRNTRRHFRALKEPWGKPKTPRSPRLLFRRPLAAHQPSSPWGGDSPPALSVLAARRAARSRRRIDSLS